MVTLHLRSLPDHASVKYSYIYFCKLNRGGTFVVDNQDRANAFQARINAAFQSDIPKVNFNGMITSLGTGDVLVVLERNGQPVAVLNASYTVAKTLSVLLGNAIAQLEELSGHPIMTTTEVEEFLAAKKPKEESTSTDAKRQKKSNTETRKVKH